MDSVILRSTLAAFCTALLIALLYTFFDRPLAEAALTLKGTGWHTLAKALSQVANGLFITTLVAIGLIFGTCDGLINGLTPRSRHVLYLCLCVGSAMLIGDVLKEGFGRARPPLLFEKGVYGFFPMAGDYMHFSFPSGHTLRIFSSMIGLGLALPRLRYPALVLAIMVGTSRVLALKHYPSDVVFGAFIGTMAALWGWKLLYPYGHRET